MINKQQAKLLLSTFCCLGIIGLGIGWSIMCAVIGLNLIAILIAMLTLGLIYVFYVLLKTW